MGGQSLSKITFDNGHAKFSGNVSTVGGGFCSCSTKSFKVPL